MNVNFKPENIYYTAQNTFTKSVQKTDKSAQDKKETQSEENLHSEKKSRLEQLRQQKQQEYEQAMQQLQKMREDEQKAEKEGRVELLCDDIPKSFILTDGGKVYLSPFNTSVYRQEVQSIPKKEK